MAFACLCSSPVQWTQCAHEHCAVVRQQWRHYLDHDSSSCRECCDFMEQIQTHVRNCAAGGFCPVLRLPFAANTQLESTSPVSSGQLTPGNDSGCGGRSGRSSASNLSADHEGSQTTQSSVVPAPLHQPAMGEMSSFSSDATFHSTHSSGFLVPHQPSLSSYTTAPSSFDPISRQNSERPTSLHRSLTPIGEEHSRVVADAVFKTAQDSLSHPVQLLPDVEESVQSINQLGHFGTTPLPSPFPAQEIVYPLNAGYLTQNPMDGQYHKFRDYIPQGEIGEGGQGTCFYGTDRILERTFVYKENYRSADESKLLAECEMMSRICHDNVVVFLGAVREDAAKVKLFMELAECGTVHQLFSDNPQYQTDTLFVAHLLQQLLSAVNHLHQSGILHRDIKGKNLLLFDGCVCKLADFGMAVHINDCRGVPDACVRGTYPYLSPEYMREQVYTFATDVWSSMAVAVEMMTGKDPWQAVNQDALVLIIGNYHARDHFHWLVPEEDLKQRLEETEQDGADLVLWYFHEVLDMMKRVFVEEHTMRPTAHDLLCENVMIQAPLIYDGEAEGEAPTSFEGVPEPVTPCHQQLPMERDSEVDGSRGAEMEETGHRSGVLLQPRSVLQPEYRSAHSWPMTASDTMETALLSSYPGPPRVVMTDQGVLIPGGRIIQIVNKRRVTVPAKARCFQRTFSQQEGTRSTSHLRDRPVCEGKRPVRRHSLAELYVMTGPEADHEP